MAKLGDMIDYLKKNSVHYEVIEHDPAFTAHDAAVASHVPDKDLAKTLIVQTDDKYCMVVMPDCELGAMPPFGNLYALPVYIDKSLTNDDEIVFNACSHTKSVRLKMNDYLGLVKPVIAEFSRSRFEIEGQ